MGGGWGGVEASPAARPRPLQSRSEDDPCLLGPGDVARRCNEAYKARARPRHSGLSSRLPQAFRPWAGSEARAGGAGGAPVRSRPGGVEGPQPIPGPSSPGAGVPSPRRRPGASAWAPGVSCVQTGDQPHLSLARGHCPQVGRQTWSSREKASATRSGYPGLGGSERGRVKPGGGSREARARSSALSRAHEPRPVPTALLSSPRAQRRTKDL